MTGRVDSVASLRIAMVRSPIRILQMIDDDVEPLGSVESSKEGVVGAAEESLRVMR